MKEEAFQDHMLSRNLAEKTRQQRTYALRRIERAEGVDLDVEFAKDGMEALLNRYRYSSADARAFRPNPTSMDIDADKLLTHLRWYLGHLQQYRMFASGIDLGEENIESSLEPEEVQAVAEAVGQTFGLERDMQIALRTGIAQLEPGMEVVDGGSEKRVAAGNIDILARDKNGVLTVIELKAGTSKPESVAQILGYMGCIAEEFGEQVRGILIAADHATRVSFAAKAVPNLALKTYRYRFEFE